jgi:hypothetical protein
VKKWLKSWFYVWNTNKETDQINLPEFNIAPPIAELHWGLNLGFNILKVNEVQDVLIKLKDAGLTAEDLISTFITRRMSPLQQRDHKIFQM